MRAKIIGTGKSVPEKIVTNDYLSTILDTNDAWIRERTGIRRRHIAVAETTTSLSLEAARQALAMADMDAGQLDLIIVATISTDYLVPSTACLVQKELGAFKATAFDINAACSGFLYALQMADAYFQVGIYKTALIIGAESLSKIADWSDRSSCVLFGDGAGAAVLAAANVGLLEISVGTDGRGAEYLSCPNRENNNPFITPENGNGYLTMHGQEVFKFAVKNVPECIQELLQLTNLTTDDISCYILHQANLRIIQSISKRLHIPLEKLPVNVDRYGNTSAASIPILLDEINREGRLQQGERILLAGFGAGFTWGAAILIW
jgi:3-oxoacyl-[acyl-carrier-protein] synthase-3